MNGNWQFQLLQCSLLLSFRNYFDLLPRKDFLSSLTSVDCLPFFRLDNYIELYGRRLSTHNNPNFLDDLRPGSHPLFTLVFLWYSLLFSTTRLFSFFSPTIFLFFGVLYSLSFFLYFFMFSPFFFQVRRRYLLRFIFSSLHLIVGTVNLEVYPFFIDSTASLRLWRRILSTFSLSPFYIFGNLNLYIFGNFFLTAHLINFSPLMPCIYP